MAEIVFLVDVGVSADVIHDALTTRDGLESWWTTDTEGSGSPGSTLSLGFPDAPARFSLQVDEVGDRGVSWTSVGEFPPHWKSTEIVFSVMDNPETEGSRLFFEHRGFEAADPMMGHTAFTWANLMTSLKAYCETGVPAPFFEA